jgi:hypothetical protein
MVCYGNVFNDGPVPVVLRYLGEIGMVLENLTYCDLSIILSNT